MGSEMCIRDRFLRRAPRTDVCNAAAQHNGAADHQRCYGDLTLHNNPSRTHFLTRGTGKVKQRTFHFIFPVPVHSMHETPRIFYATAKVNGNLTKLFVPYATPITSKRRNFLLMSCIISWSGSVDQMKVKPSLYPPALPQKLHVCKRIFGNKKAHTEVRANTKESVSLAGGSSANGEFQCRARPRSQRGREQRPTRS